MGSVENIPGKQVSLKEKVAFLLRPASYGGRVRMVETKETHMSWIFLADDTVYKLKKPVAFAFLDFRSLESRLANCQEELRLNRRLAPGIYLGLTQLVVDGQGVLTLGGEGRIVDYLVRMRRISEDSLLDHAIQDGTVESKQLEDVAALLSGFYLSAPPVRVDVEEHKEELLKEVQLARDRLIDPLFNFDGILVESICSRLLTFLKTQFIFIAKRIRSGKIIEAHGDLRPEHICLRPEPAIIDALEFSRELRVMDIAEELAFLEMECEMLGDPNCGKLIREHYSRTSGDEIPPPLLHFYKSKKALLRAFLKARHILEPGYCNDPKWLRLGRAYLQLAGKYAELTR